MSSHLVWNLLNKFSNIDRNEHWRVLAILVNELNKFYIEWPPKLYSIYNMNTMPTLIST